ncbi:erythromycin esterase family protein [Halorubellus salinus]|uniref:erythromycin esterase family protein n=1 Tax=Halorubellus salinus TaxID=755309 RepID=UPI001D09181E|nr:erythromycin esterase family protein [Halorubellus salinus]
MTHSTGLLDALDDHSLALETTDPTSDGDGLEALCDELADVRVVGLGESTHGTREFFELKHRLVRELVERHGLRTFAIEAGFGEARRVNAYVRDGEGSAEEVVEGMQFWTWRTESFVAFVEWLREFNRDREPDEQVSFWGVDAQYAAASADHVVAFLERAAGDPIEGLDALAADGLYGYVGETDDAVTLKRAREIVDRTNSRFDADREALVDATDERAWRLARQHVRSMVDAVAFAESTADGPPDADALARRDRAMADTTDWVLEYTGADAVVLWAHDGHLARDPMHPEHLETAVETLGSHLDDDHGDAYHPVALVFGSGSFQAIGETADGTRGLRAFSVDEPTDSLEADLHALGDDIAYLDFESARADSRLVEWFQDAHRMHAIGAHYAPDDAGNWTTYDLGRAFDGALYVDETTRARPAND